MALSTDDYLIYSLCACGICGLLVNVLLFVIMISKKSIRSKEYAIFILIRACVDIFVCVQMVILQPIAIGYWNQNPLISVVAAGFYHSSFFISLFSDPLLACSRYISVCHKNSYPTIFTRRNTILFCVLNGLAGFLATVPHIFGGSLGRVYGFFCSVKFERKYMLLEDLCDYSIFTVAYALMGFFYYKVFVALRKHIEQTTSNAMVSRLREDKSLLKFIGAAALLPVITESPAAALVAIQMLEIYTFPTSVVVGCQTVLFLCPLFNGVLTMIMLRPVNKALRGVTRHLCNANQASVGSVISQQRQWQQA